MENGRSRSKICFFSLLGGISLLGPLSVIASPVEEESYWLQNGRIRGELLWEILSPRTAAQKKADIFFEDFIKTPPETPETQIDLAACYYYGKGTPVDYTRAFSLLSQNSALEDGRGLGLLGLCYSFGHGLPARDDQRALPLFEKAAQKRNAEALNMLGICHQFGIHKKRDLTKAVEFYRQASEKNHPPALTNLGFFYSEGLGVDQDTEKAVSLYKIAARQGDPGALNNLGLCYEEGKGRKQNPMKAFHLYRQSAKQGDHAGQVNLGSFYLFGKGSIPLNRPKGLKYIKRAAAQDDKFARAILIDIGEALMTAEFQKLSDMGPLLTLLSKLKVI